MSQQGVPATKQSLPTSGLFNTPSNWVREKSQRDVELRNNSADEWVVENKRYDLTKFIDKHPGGRQWIEYTKGQDITELFITHHLSEDKARAVLDKFYVGECDTKHQTRYTFQQDGLFRRAKRRLLEAKTPKELQNWDRSFKLGCLFLSVFLLLFVACGLTQSYLLAVLTGIAGYPVLGIAHNFIHMRWHPFRYLWLISGYTHIEWEKMHCLSHHSFTNTLLDYEATALEPVVCWLKVSQPNVLVFSLLKQVMFMIAAPLSSILKVFVLPVVMQYAPDFWYLANLLQIPVLHWMGAEWETAGLLYMTIHTTMSLMFFNLPTFVHRTGQEWTEGNREIRDYGEHHVATSTNVTDNCAGFWSFVIYMGFNTHTAHHFFPTIDHHELPLARRIIEGECGQMGVKCNESPNLWQAIWEMECNYVRRKQWVDTKR